MAEEIVWVPPEWPPEESGTYSADLKVEGVLKKVFPRRVKQKDGSGVIDYTAVHVQWDKTSRVADILNESETRSALGPHSSTGYEGLFEMWLPNGASIGVKEGDNVVCITKGASQVLNSIQASQKGGPANDPLAHLVTKLQKEAAGTQQEGANDDEWDD